MNIPRFLQLYKEGRLEDAFEAVILDNPLPCIHRARVPASVRQALPPARLSTMRSTCANSSLHRRYDFAVRQVRIDRRERIARASLHASGRKVAVVGAGPAGLTAAFYLALLGHDVTVFDPMPEPGGMLRFALPEYRLPKSVLHREIGAIERLGVKFVLNTRVGSDISLNELDERYDAVFLAIGTWKESWLYLVGTDLKGVYPALSLLQMISQEESVPLGKKVVVIGGGNAAIDSARTALRLGAEVTVVYRRERKDMPAIEEETAAAEEEGAKLPVPGGASSRDRRRQGKCPCTGGGEDSAWRIRHLRPPQADSVRMRCGESSAIP